MSAPVSKKADEGKRQWHLLPWQPLESVLEVLEFGAKKYVEDGWRRVENGEQRYRDALMRHAVRLSEDLDAVDAETGFPEAAHVACNALFLLWFRAQRMVRT